MRGPIVASGLHRKEVVLPDKEDPGSEILIPLFQGDRLVGLWSVRHSDPNIYRQADGELLNLLAPQLALSLSLTGLVSPIAEASDEVADYFAQLMSTSEELHASAEEVAAAATHAEDGAGRAARLIVDAAHNAQQMSQTTGHLAEVGGETRNEAEQMEKAAQQVRAETHSAVRELLQLAKAVETGTSEVSRLREAAKEVERFSETIAGIAYQTNLLALNATIESARAGVQAGGFGVVADEVRKLAEESSREASKVAKSVEGTRQSLDKAVALLEQLRTGVSRVATGIETWFKDLDRIVDAAEQTAKSGRKVADIAEQNRGFSTEIDKSLVEAEEAAKLSARESESMASAADEQLRSVEELTRGASELSGLTDRLAKATQFVRGNGAR